MLDKRRYSDRAEYIKRAVDKRRKKIKEIAVTYKGGKCLICGYNRWSGALEFHHLNNKIKDFGLAKHGLTRSWERTKKEIDKCILVCSNCHREIHAGLIDKKIILKINNSILKKQISH